MDRVERPEQLVDDDPVEQAVMGDLPPERRHQPHGVGVVQNRVGVPSPVARPDPGRERRRTADPCCRTVQQIDAASCAEHTGARHGIRFLRRPVERSADRSTATGPMQEPDVYCPTSQ